MPSSTKHPLSRRCFYQSAPIIHGLMLVHNVSYPKSYSGLYSWLKEFSQHRTDQEAYPPILVIGTHADTRNKYTSVNDRLRCPIAEETNGFSITVDLSRTDGQSLRDPQTKDILEAFWHRVISHNSEKFPSYPRSVNSVYNRWIQCYTYFYIVSSICTPLHSKDVTTFYSKFWV